MEKHVSFSPDILDGDDGEEDPFDYGLEEESEEGEEEIEEEGEEEEGSWEEVETVQFAVDSTCVNLVFDKEA